MLKSALFCTFFSFFRARENTRGNALEASFFIFMKKGGKGLCIRLFREKTDAKGVLGAGGEIGPQSLAVSGSDDVALLRQDAAFCKM